MLHADYITTLASCNTLHVALSGGLDSLVLLHMLSQHENLLPKLVAIHVHHGLHADADHWAEHCKLFCARRQIPCYIEHIMITGRNNLEAKARTARYKILQSYMQHPKDILLTAHHMQDQAETVLLNLFRGAGITGLCAMPTIKKFGCGQHHRPLLLHTRDTLRDYAQQEKITWIDDPSNTNILHARNFIRHTILPALQTRWPSISTLARTATLAQEAQENLDALAVLDAPSLRVPADHFFYMQCATLPLARLHNVLRYWIKINRVRPLNRVTQTRIVQELIYARKDAAPCIYWDNHAIRRYQGCLYLTTPHEPQTLESIIWQHFPAACITPHCTIQASPARAGILITRTQRIEIRFQPRGAVIQQNGQHKKIKKLMQLWKIPPWQRATIPCLYLDGICAAVPGYIIAEPFCAENRTDVYSIHIN